MLFMTHSEMRLARKILFLMQVVVYRTTLDHHTMISQSYAFEGDIVWAVRVYLLLWG